MYCTVSGGFLLASRFDAYAVTKDMVDEIKAKFANFTAVDGLCLTDDVGFVSVSNPESVLRLYKKPTKKSLSLKKLIKL